MMASSELEAIPTTTATTTSSSSPRDSSRIDYVMFDGDDQASKELSELAAELRNIAMKAKTGISNTGQKSLKNAYLKLSEFRPIGEKYVELIRHLSSCGDSGGKCGLNAVRTLANVMIKDHSEANHFSHAGYNESWKEIMSHIHNLKEKGRVPRWMNILYKIASSVVNEEDHPYENPFDRRRTRFVKGALAFVSAVAIAIAKKYGDNNTQIATAVVALALNAYVHRRHIPMYSSELKRIGLSKDQQDYQKQRRDSKEFYKNEWNGGRANNLFSVGGDSMIEDIPFERGDPPSLDPAEYADGGFHADAWPPPMDMRGTKYGGEVCVGEPVVMATFYAILVVIIIGLVIILHWGPSPQSDTKFVKIGLGVAAVLAGAQAMRWYKKRQPEDLAQHIE